MKTTFFRTVTVAWLAAVVSGTVLADQAQTKPAKDTKPATNPSFTGIVSSVDAKENILAVKNFLLRKSFTIGENCVFSVGGREDARLTDLRPGYRVMVTYVSASGVPVASRVRQDDLTIRGNVDVIDKEARTMSVKQGWFLRKFALPQECMVLLRENREGDLGDLKIGHRVEVTYRKTNDGSSAYRIVQGSREFAGTINAIDASTDTVKARHLVGEKKFNLAKGCKIMVNGRKNARLADLKLGEKAEFSYELINGVAIVHRIAQGAEPVITASAEPEEKPARKVRGEFETSGLTP